MKRGTPRHPKIFDLMQAMELPQRARAVVIGHLELLWHFTAEFAPQGDIGKYSDDRIEGAMDWHGKRGKLIEALTTSKWCDKSDRHRLIVHDWHDHADDAVKKRLARSELQFLTFTEKLTGHCPQPTRTTADNGSLPEPCLASALPVPSPEPPVRAVLPAIKSALKPARAADLNGQTSSLFNEFWERYPRKQHKDAACHEWVSVVDVDSEPLVFACLSRYLASDEVSRGAVANPEKWLMEQYRDGWAGTWPGIAPRAQESRETPTQAAIRKAKETQNGTR